MRKIDITIKQSLLAETAYSSNRYVSWDACIKMLRKRGYSDQEINAILRSKWTRWAADYSNKKHGHATSKDLERYLDHPSNHFTKEEVKQLVAGTDWPEKE